MIHVTMNGRRRKMAQHHIRRYRLRQANRVIDEMWWMNHERIWLSGIENPPWSEGAKFTSSGPSMNFVK